MANKQTTGIDEFHAAVDASAQGLITKLRIENTKLRAELEMLHCLDVTSREGQRAFNEWRERSANQHD